MRLACNRRVNEGSWSHLTFTQWTVYAGWYWPHPLPTRKYLLLPVPACFISEFRYRHPFPSWWGCVCSVIFDSRIALRASRLGKVLYVSNGSWTSLSPPRKGEFLVRSTDPSVPHLRSLLSSAEQVAAPVPAAASAGIIGSGGLLARVWRQRLVRWGRCRVNLRSD